jgi:hypothetical protein
METETTPEIELTHIGTIDQGADGQDIYYLLRRLDDDLTATQAEDYLAPRFRWGNEDDHPNLITCSGMKFLPVAHKPDRFICIVKLSQNN